MQRLVFVVAACALVTWGCGSASDGAAMPVAPMPSAKTPDGGATGACDQTVALADFVLQPSELHAKSGKLELCVENRGKTPHDLAVRDASAHDLGRTPTLSQGGQSRLSLALAAGTYGIYCAEPGHESLGMHGMLIVSD